MTSERDNRQDQDDDTIGGWVRSAAYLGRVWTVPRNAAPIDGFSKEDQERAAWLGVAGIVLFTWALRGVGAGQAWWTAPVAALAGASSLNWVSMRLRALLDQVIVISGYVTVAFLMLLTLLIRASFEGQGWYSQLEADLVQTAHNIVGPDFLGASVIAPIMLAAPVTWIVWLLKAGSIDRHSINMNGVIYAGLVTLIGALCVIFVCIIGDEVFAKLPLAPKPPQ